MEQVSIEGDSGVRDFVRVCIRRRRLIGAVVVATLLVTLAAILLARPLYRARAIVQVEDERPGFGLEPERGYDMRPSPLAEAEAALVLSRLVLDPVVRELGFDTLTIKGRKGAQALFASYASAEYPAADEPEFTIELAAQGAYKAYDEDGALLGAGILGKPFAGKGVDWVLDIRGAQPGDKVVFKKLPFEDGLEYLRDNLAVNEIGKKTNLITIGLDLPDPQLARDTIDRIAKAYLEQNLTRKSQVATQTLELIEEQLRIVEGNMERGERELNDFKSEKGIFVLSEEADRLIEQISKLEINRADLQLQQQQIQQIATALTRGRDNDFLLGEVSVKDKLITSLAQDLTGKLVELRTLKNDYAAGSPRVDRLQSEVNTLKAKIRAAVNNANMTLQNQLATAEKLLGKYETQVKALPQAERQMAALARKSEVNGDLYSFLLKKHEEARIARAGIIGNLRIVEDPTVSDRPVWPRPVKALELALLAGLLLGVAAAMLVNYLDDAIQEPRELERLYRLNLYGEIPRDTAAAAREPVFKPLATGDASYEAYRTLATNVGFAATQRDARSWAITSAAPGEGKSTVAANLACLLACRGARVLLIDADLRRPRLHSQFSLLATPGLGEVLAGKAEWRKCAQAVGVYKLDVIAAGHPPVNQVEMLDGARFRAFVAEAKAEYEYVIFDTPPVIAFTDAPVIARQVDGVFVVAAMGLTSQRDFERALRLLQSVATEIVGAIATRAIVRQTDRYYAEYYSPPAQRTWRGQLKRLRDLFVRT